MYLVTLHQQLKEPGQQPNITGVKTDGIHSSHREQHLDQTEGL